MILAHQGKQPIIGDEAFVADNATVIGDVILGMRASIWFGCVVRGDVEKIRIGADTNIQDLSVIHVNSDGHPTRVGEKCTVGHRVVLHGCTVGKLCLVGMGSIVMDGAEIGDETILGAGSLVPPGAKIPGGVLALGSPARVVRPLTEKEKAFLAESAAQYVRYAAGYRK